MTSVTVTAMVTDSEGNSASAVASAEITGVVINAAPGELAAAALQLRDANRAGQSAALVLESGAVYRESLILQQNDPLSTDAPQTIIGNGAVITGSDVFADWQPVGDGTFWHHWPHQLGKTADRWPGLYSYDPRLNRREMLWIGSQPYYVVNDGAAIAAGEFRVEEDAQRIVVRPKAADVGFSVAEVAVRVGVLRCQGQRNVTIRDVIFERSAGGVEETGVSTWNCPNILYEDVTVRQCAASGLATGGDESTDGGATWRRVSLQDNGLSHGGMFRQNNALIEDCQSFWANRRGRGIGYHLWAEGIKFGLCTGFTMRNFTAWSNFGPSVWFDWEVRDALLDNVHLFDNFGSQGALTLEANRGPVTIRNSRICRNKSGGIWLWRADNVAIENTRIIDNGYAQITVGGSPSPVVMPDGYAVRGVGLRLHDSVIAGTNTRHRPGDGRDWLTYGGYGDIAAEWWANVDTQRNQWSHPLTDPHRHPDPAGVTQTMTTAKFGEHAGSDGTDTFGPVDMRC